MQVEGRRRDDGECERDDEAWRSLPKLARPSELVSSRCAHSTRSGRTRTLLLLRSTRRFVATARSTFSGGKLRFPLAGESPRRARSLNARLEFPRSSRVTDFALVCSPRFLRPLSSLARGCETPLRRFLVPPVDRKGISIFEVATSESQQES